jgi:hypothetical protein
METNGAKGPTMLRFYAVSLEDIACHFIKLSELARLCGASDRREAFILAAQILRATVLIPPAHSKQSPPLNEDR